MNLLAPEIFQGLEDDQKESFEAIETLQLLKEDLSSSSKTEASKLRNQE